MTTLVSPISTTPTRWWIATLDQRRSAACSTPAIRSISASAMPSYASYSSRTTSRPREWARVVPVNVAIAPASSDATSRTASSSESGSSESRNAPARDGRDQRDLVAVRERRCRARAYALVDREQQPRRLVAEFERGPDVGGGRPPRAARSRRVASRRSSRSPANRRTATFIAVQRIRGCSTTGACHVTSDLWRRRFPRANLNEQVYETLAAARAAARPGPGREAQPARARDRARRLAQPRAPRADPARLRGPAVGQGAARLLRDARDGGDAGRRLRRPARARAARRRAHGRLASTAPSSPASAR